jgi:hypothetical protein
MMVIARCNISLINDYQTQRIEATSGNNCHNELAELRTQPETRSRFATDSPPLV